MNPLEFTLPDVYTLSVVDFNGDTLMDMVTVSASLPSVLRVYKNNGDETFSEIASFPAFENCQLEIIDYNQDNLPDIFVLGYATTDSVAAFILEGQEEMSFLEVRVPLEMSSVSAFLWLQYDNHSLPDLFISGFDTNSSSASSVVLLQGQESFQQEETIFSDQQVLMIKKIANPEPLFYLEMVKDQETKGGFYTLQDGQFQVLPTEQPSFNSSVLAQGDLNQDGEWDLFSFGKLENGEPGGKILFGQEESYEISSLPLELEVQKADILDLTNDGKAEILFLGKNERSSGLYLASESGSYSPKELIPSADHYFLADLDKDGKPEVLVLEASELRIFKNADKEENKAPQRPQTFLSVELEEGFFLTWTNGKDDKTAEEALTYEVMVLEAGGRNFHQSSLVDEKSGYDKIFRFGSIGTENILEVKQALDQPVQLFHSTFDQAYHTGPPSICKLEVSEGVGSNSVCINNQEETLYICEPTKGQLKDLLQFEADYWVSHQKGYLGKGETELEITESDYLYGIKIEGECIEFLTTWLIYANHKEAASIQLEACEGDILELTPPIPGKSYTWFDKDRNELSAEETFVQKALKSDTLFLERMPLSGGCPAIDTFLIKVYPLPSLEVMSGTSIRSGEEIRLSAWGADSYEWFPKEGLLDPEAESPVARPLQTTTYQVIGRNAIGCEVQDSVTIIILKDFFVPSLFSPNSDGKNDRLSLMGSGIKEIHFRIYDKAGNLVFEANSPQEALKGWDGNYKGRPLPAGNYAWEFKGFFEDGSPLQFENKSSGFITMIR